MTMTDIKSRLYQNSKKSTAVTYIFWLFGLHYLYLGMIPTFLLYLFTLGWFGLWVLADMFRIPGLVARANLQLMDLYGIDKE